MRVTIDIGKSGTRARAHSDAFPGSAEGRSATYETSGMEPTVAGSASGASHLVDVIAAALRAVLGDQASQLGSVVVSSTAVPPDAGAVVDAVGAMWPRAEIALFEDNVVSHAAALGAPGVVATVGTGIGIAGLDGRGRLIRVDGWGPDLGDRGSAWQIGRDGLRAAFAARDGAGPETALEAEAESFLGAIDLQRAVRLLAAPDRVAAISDFAQVVCRTSDEVAAQILDHAADDLLGSVGAAVDLTSTGTVVLRGRLLRSAAYRELLEAGCRRRGWELREPERDVLDVDHHIVLSPPYLRHGVTRGASA